MLLELGVPQGQVVSRWKGGETVVGEALEKMKGASFTGYLKVVLSRDGEHSEGLISVAAGVPELSLYVFRPIGAEEIWSFGDKAAGYLWADSEQAEAAVSLHDEVKLSDLGLLIPQARLSRIEPPGALGPRQFRKDDLTSADPAQTGDNVRRVLGGLTPASQGRADQQAQGVYDLILQFYNKRSPGPDAPSCPECGGPLDLLGHCPSCTPEGDADVPPTRLDPRFTFESLSSGHEPRFAEAAARAVAADPGRLYNPLFIHGRSGLGKTHLLQAIGDRVARERPDLGVVYLPFGALDGPQTELAFAPGGELRQKMEEAVVLLLDDVQFIAGNQRLQEEVLRAIDLLAARGKQVVITGDQPPREIAALSDRLTSRIESGLTVEVTAPDAAARQAILRRMTADKGLAIPEEVIAFVADMCPQNVRQLGGGMNKVIAFGSLMRSEVSVQLAQEVLGQPRAGQRRPELHDRRSYLVEEPRPELSYQLLNAQIDRGYKALVFSRSNPAAVQATLGGRQAEIYWLTEHESAEDRSVHPSLEKIVLLVESFLHQGGKVIIFLDDLQYLISNSTFEGVIRFVRAVVDQVTEGQAIFMLSVSLDSLKVQERSVLEREMEPLRP